MLDVRAPVEFSRGAFPGACNIPLLDDEQRRQVGICYKQQGQEAAIALGHELVSGAVKAERLRDWQAFFAQQQQPVLYCFRGGLRSRIVQQWLAAEGLSVPRVAGGYKALRRFLLDTLEAGIDRHRFMIIAGKTGSGKTHLLNKLPGHIDLEGQANHRGSAFGTRVDGQPGQIDFENRLAIDFLRLLQTAGDTVFLEDESSAIGSLSLPRALIQKMRNSPIAVLEVPLAERIDTILHDYILANLQDWRAQTGDRAEEHFANYLRSSLHKIQRRLGAERYDIISQALEAALSQQSADGSVDAHRVWINELLTNYYDPMYDYQLNKKLDRLCFRGNKDEFLAWSGHLSKRTSGTSP